LPLIQAGTVATFRSAGLFICGLRREASNSNAGG
jgi:hypothetical protein